MRDLLLQVRDGLLSFDRFVAKTSSTWQKMATNLSYRWRIPAGVTADDICQEVLLGVWDSIHEWDSSRGVEIEQFVKWSARNRAKRWIHVQRGATYHPDRDRVESRFPMLAKTDFDLETAEFATCESTQEQIVDALYRVKSAVNSLSEECRDSGECADVMRCILVSGSIDRAIEASGHDVSRKLIFESFKRTVLSLPC